MTVFTLKINGRPYRLDIDGSTLLLWALRDHLKLSGTKFGCGEAYCGACTVFVAGSPVRFCSLPVGEVGEAEVTTIEGVGGREAVAVQKAWIAHDGRSVVIASPARS